MGTAYVALFNYAFARRHGGAFILRIEDTDRQRSSAASEKAIIDNLRWLGLTWDEGPDVGGPFGPYRQSERAAIYREHCDRLVEAGHAYRCFCSEQRLRDLRERQRSEKLKLGYDGLCRDLDPAASAQRAQEGETYVIRLKMPRDGETVLDDLLRGPIAIANEQSDDQVLLKSDGMPTYHLANVVDDHLMGISHVVRAEEWISSAPKHLCLYRAFGWTPPTFAHLPLLRNNDKNKSKISKRRNPVSLEYYRAAGIIPTAMVNFLALMGWSFGDDQEKFTLPEMVERLDLKQGEISLSGPVFDLEKLNWLNSLYLNDLSDEQLVDDLMAWRLNREYLLRLAPLLRERIRRFDEFVPAAEYFFSGDLHYEPVRDLLVPKKRTPAQAAKVLSRLADALDQFPSWEAHALEEFFRTFCEDNDWKTREVFMMMRIVATGRKASPPLFETMVVIGREMCRRRLRQAVAYLRTIK